ncbi:transposase [Streptomyces mirabilis]|uniref:transposase n=1 Tax=Streptomyces mirabilis TaxID=68239 RepID=UPI0036DA6032
MGRIAGRFTRVEPRRRAREFVLGLLSDLPRKNCWTLAEHAGDATPYGLQHLLSRAKWDADEVRDDLRSFAIEQLHDEEAALAVDEMRLATLVRVAGRRWTVEETFQAAKGLAGLDEHQVRRWTSWHRWVTLAMLAHGFLAAASAHERDHHPAPGELILLTCNEIQHPFVALTTTARPAAHHHGWSVWRRRHQARSRACHYQRQAAHQRRRS